jgi:hypothetical protein
MSNAPTTSNGMTSLKGFYNSLSNGSLRDDSQTLELVPNYQFQVSIDIYPTHSKFNSPPYKEMLDNIKYAVRYCVLPNLTVPHKTEEIMNEFGNVTLPGTPGVVPEKTDFYIVFLNYNKSLHEVLFLDWMYEVHSNVWAYADTPYSMANIKVYYFDQKMQKILYTYNFMNCFPHFFDAKNPDYSDTDSLERAVAFQFDWMYVSHPTESILIPDNPYTAKDAARDAINDMLINNI